MITTIKAKLNITEESVLNTVLPRVLSVDKAEHLKRNHGIIYRYLPDFDLATAYYLPFQDNGIISITENLITGIGISETELHNHAVSNILRQVRIEKLENIIAMLLEQDAVASENEIHDMPLYVASNESSFLGAGVLAGGYEALHLFSDKLHTNSFIIIPSSVHEVIILPYDETFRIKDLLEMNREVNTAVCQDEDVLCNNVYLANMTTGTIKRAI